MWITCKLKTDKTLADIAAQYKIKQWQALMLHPKNAKFKSYARKGAPVPAGSTVFVLDPKVKVYVFKEKGKTVLLTEKEWKLQTLKMRRAMKMGLEAMERGLLRAQRGHDFQLDLNKKHPIIGIVVQKWAGKGGREPVAARRIAEGAVSALKKVVKAEKYGEFENAITFAENCIDRYRKDLGAWLDQQTGSAENWAKGLGYVKTCSFVIFAIGSTMAIAPVGAVATVGTGVGVGATTSFMMGLSEIVGKDMYGDSNDNKGAADKLLRDTIVGGVTGGAGAGLNKFMTAKVLPAVATRITSAPVARKLATKFFNSAPGKKVFVSLVTHLENRAVSALGGQGAKSVTVDKLVRDNLLEPVMGLVVKMGTGGAGAIIKGRFKTGKFPGWCTGFLKSNWSSVKNVKSEEEIANILSAEAEKNDALMLELFGVLVVSQLGPLRAELEKVLAAEIKKMNSGKKAA